MADDLRGITEKKMKNGEINIMVRFKYDGTTYPVKNFTKLFGCNTRSDARDKLYECKVMLSKGENPFISNPDTLTAIWKERVTKKKLSGEWNELTIQNYNYYYYKHIHKVIGKKKLHRITYSDLEKIISNMKKYQGGTKNRLKKLLYPIFDDAIKSGLVHKNIALELKSHKIGNNKNIKLRTENKNLELARALYKQIPKYQAHCKAQREEFRMFLYMVALTAHRIGELLLLTKEMVVMKHKKIISAKSITKTKEEYHFPIPDECLEYIDSIESGLLFPTLRRGSIYNIFQRLVDKIVQNENIIFNDGKTISPHDMRRIMLNIMIIDCKIDGFLADSCLSHKQSGSTKHYVGFEDEHIRDAYERYWDKLRLSDIEYNQKYGFENQATAANNSKSNTEQLIELGDMFKQGLLSKEEFIALKSSLI